MKRSCNILPPFRPPWRYDLYQALFSALLPNSLAQRGEGRARELYHQAQMIAEKTGEEMSALMWSLATLESAMNTSAAEEEFQSLPSSQTKPSRQAAFFGTSGSKRSNPSSQSSRCSQPYLLG